MIAFEAPLALAASKVVLPLKYTLHRQQGRALRSKATERLFGGAAGGGKSHLMRVEAIHWCMAIPNVQVFLFRRFFTDIIQNHMEGPTSFPALLESYADNGHAEIVQKEIRFWNGSKIYLRHCLNEKALLKYQGAEIHVLMFDELTHFTEAMYRFLRGRCRLGSLVVPPEYKGLFPRILSGANPGGIGHQWVKRTFIDPGPYAIRQQPDVEGGMFRQFIPSKVEDNPSLLKNDPDYLKKLEGLGDPMLVRAMREGDWDVVAGSMFGDTWRRNLHVCPPFDIPDTWEKWRGGDDGFGAPSAVYWFTKDPVSGTVYVIDELYKTQMLPRELAEATLERDKRIPVFSQEKELYASNVVLTGYYDSAAFSNTGQEATTRGQQLNNAGCRWEPVPKWPGSVVARVQNFHRMLAPNENDPKKLPGIRFFERCSNAIRTIPTLMRDAHNPETIADDQEDHAFDGVTYGLQWKRPLFKKMKIGGI